MESTAANASHHATHSLQLAGHVKRCRTPLRAFSHMCVGSCCAPLARNRSCLFRSLLFTPPNNFYYLRGDDAPDSTDNFTTYKRGTFFGALYQPLKRAVGGPQAVLSGDRFAPTTVSLHSANASHRRCITAPLFIGSTLHWNIGHTMLDLVFPAVAAMARLRVRLRAAAKAQAKATGLDAWASSAQSLGNVIHGAAPFFFVETGSEAVGLAAVGSAEVAKVAGATEAVVMEEEERVGVDSAAVATVAASGVGTAAAATAGERSSSRSGT